ncbi:MAG: acyl-ACP--UDP-N-acetylglucosamine O-acyltransferase [Gammaproteobacteria bacterium]
MIHPTAIIDPAAELAEDVSVGAYSIIGPGVTVGKGCEIGPHVSIKGPTHIGENNRIFQFASVGEEPQDLKYRGEDTQLVIGDNNVIREFVTLHRGTTKGHGKTTIGSNNLLMAYVHVAHDCEVGNNVIFSNASSLAGHVVVEDHVILSGFTLVHQFCRIGAHAFTGMGSALNRDLTPYTMASGNYAHAVGINKEGLKRRGFTPETIQALRRAFKTLIRCTDRAEALEAVQEDAAKYPEVGQLRDFVLTSNRGVIR